MTNDQLHDCYTSYLRRHPEMQLLKSIDFKGIKHISKCYLFENEVLSWSNLPSELSISELEELNERHKGKLCWKLLESSLTAKQIEAFEDISGLKFPEEFRNFLLGYTPLLGTIVADFVGSEDYYCYSFDANTNSFNYLFDDDDYSKSKIAKVLFSFIPILYKNELSCLGESYPMLLPYGLLYLGELCCVGQEMIFLDCTDGEVVSIYHDEFFPDKISDKQLDNIKHFRFKNFDHFLRCMLGIELYDAQLEDKQRVEEYLKRPKSVSNSPNVIAL